MAIILRNDNENEPVVGGDLPTTSSNGMTREQTAVIYDTISEGPIEGLVDQGASIKLNGNPAYNYGDKDIVAILDSNDVSYVASTGVITDNNNPSFIDSANTAQGSRDVLIVGGSKAGTITTTIGNTTITSASGFTFAASDVIGEGEKRLQPQIRITSAGIDGSDLITTITEFVSSTSVKVALAPSASVSGTAVELDYVGTVSSYDNSNNRVTITAGGRNVSNVSATLSTPERTSEQAPLAKYDNFLWAFRNGEREQSYLPTPSGVGSGSAAHTVSGGDLKTVPNTGYPAWNQLRVSIGDNPTYTGTTKTVTADEMGIDNPGEVDLIRCTFNFPQGCYKWKAKDSTLRHAGALIRIKFHYQRGSNAYKTVIVNGASSYSNLPRKEGYTPDDGHYAAGGFSNKTKQGFNYLFEFDISKYGPFDDYYLTFERINEVGGEYGNWVVSNNAVLKVVENIVMDRLSYPYSAFGAVIVDAQDFSSIPKRSYEIRGLKVQVPTNYFPKDELIQGSSVRRTTPSYTRNVTSGVDTSNYTDWDGNFRGDIKTFAPGHANYDTVYTSNPVWIFMDLMTNPRYGLGQYINPDFDFAQIDRYTLFGLAKYCDELVPDGKGGQEPRFECNIYIQKSTNAIKVLKDFSSTMRSMLIWWNGSVTLGANIQKGAVYTFTKSNVIDGTFSYAGTSSRFKHNQVIVTWTNPEKQYKQDNVVIEDSSNIAKTGQVKTKNVTAFGCTSKGQAIRYGKWHLFSELNEEEIVNFSTGINGAMLRPGDVLNVQDPDVHDVVASGRVTTTTSSSSTVIKTDRDISSFLNTTDNFNLHLIYPLGGAYLTQQSATINSVDYKQGDLVLVDESGAAIDTDVKASNVRDDSGSIVQLFWSDEVRVETKPISSFNTTSITVSSAFSSAPNAEVIYTVSGQEEDGGNVAGSLKQYIVTSIKEDIQNLTFAISAQEYKPEKFTKIDRGYLIPDIPTVMQPPKDTDAVPEPTSVALEMVASGFGSEVGSTTDRDLLISWQHPVTTRVDDNGNNINDVYEHLSGYEIAYRHPGVDDPDKFIRITIPSLNTTSHNLSEVSGNGEIIVRVRTINTLGITSSWEQRRLTVNEEKILPFGVPTLGEGLNGGIMKGGILSCPINIESANGTVTFASSSYTFDSPSSEEESTITVSSGNTAFTTQADFDNLSDGQTGYLLLDHDGSLSRGATRTDLLQPIVFHTEETTTDIDGTENYFKYVKRLGESNEDFVQASGTITLSANSTEVSGSSTAFTTDFQPGDVIIIDTAGATRFFSTVSHITSDTALSLSTVSTRSYSGKNVFRQALRISNAEDCILGSVTNTSGVYSFINFSSGNRGTDAYSINGTNENHNFPSNAAGVVSDFSSFSNSYTVNKGTISYTFASSGSATNTFGLSTATTNCTAVVNSSTGVITVTAITADTASLIVTITDRGTSETIGTRVVSLGKSIPGAAGAGTDSRTVNLTASDYSITYAADGTTPTPSGTITLTATSQNFSNPFFKFTGDGISDEGTFTDGSGASDTFSFSIPSNIVTTPQTIKVGVSEANQTELAFDTITLTSLQQGSQGTDGAPAYTAIITNEAHTFPSSNTGVVSSFGGSGTKIEVYKGATQLTPVANTGTPGTGQYDITTTATNITVGSFTLNTGSEKNITVADHSGVANGTDNSEIEYSINIENDVTLTKAQTFTKSKKGTDGDDGATGKKVKELILYYPANFNNNTFSIPTTPTSGVYHFGNNVIASIASGWQQAIPDDAAGAIYWTSETLATESSTANTSGSLSWSTPGNSRTPQFQVEFIFQRSANQPTTPSITNFPVIPTNWYDDIADVPSGSDAIWVSKGTTQFSLVGGTYGFKTTWQAATRIEGSNGTDGTDGDDGNDGASNFTVFQESNTPPSQPSAGTSNPPTSTWYSTLTAARNAVSGDGLVWFSVGTKPGTSNTITWSVPIRYVEEYDHVGGTKPPFDANKFLVPVNTTDGIFSFSIDGVSDTYEVLDSTSRTRFGRLRAGTDPIDGTNSIRNAGITLTSAGVLGGAGGGTLDLNDVNDTGSTKTGAARANAGLTSDGDVDRAVPVGVGGTGQTNTNKFLNSGISISQGNSGVFTLTKGDGTTDTTTITKGKLGLSYTDGADVTGDNTANDVSNVNGTAASTVQGGAARANAGLTSVGDVSRAVPVGAGGTGQTNTNKFLNSDLGITLDGNNITLTKAGDTNSTDTVPTALKNSNIAINGSGQLTGIGTGVNTVISNASIVAGDISGSGKAFAVLPASGATVGAVLGTNLKASNGTTTLGDNDVKNTALDVDIDGTSMRLKIGSTVTSTVTATQGLVGLSGVSNNADQTSSNTANDVSNVNGTAASTVKAGAVRANAGLTSTGDVNRAVPVGVGGTGQTATNKFLNSDIGIAMDGTNVTITKAGDTNSAVAIPGTLKNTNISFSRPTTGTLRLNNGSNNDITLTAADAQITSDSSGINVASVRKATHNGNAINSSGNVTSSMSVASGGSIVVGNITIDGTNGRILITD